MTANTAKTYKFNVAKMIAGSKTKNTGKQHIVEEVADGEFIVKEYVAIKPVAAKAPRTKKVDALVTATLPVFGNPDGNVWWVGAKDEAGKVVWFLKKFCRVADGQVTVKMPWSKAKTRTNVAWQAAA